MCNMHGCGNPVRIPTALPLLDLPRLTPSHETRTKSNLSAQKRPNTMFMCQYIPTVRSPVQADGKYRVRKLLLAL